MSQNLFYDAACAFVRLYSHLMLEMDVQWQAPLPAGPKLFAPNHPSVTDPFVIHMLSSEPMSVLIVSTAFTFPLFGEYIRRAGQIQVLPGQGTRALEQAEEVLRAGNSVGIFPEGRFSPIEGGFGQPRSGAARLALRTGVPVIPVGIYLPRERIRRIASRLSGTPTEGYWYLRGSYHITVGHPMQLEGDPENQVHVRSGTERIMERIRVLAYESEMRFQNLEPAGSAARATL